MRVTIKDLYDQLIAAGASPETRLVFEVRSESEWDDVFDVDIASMVLEDRDGEQCIVVIFA
jgi:hypothetical protein